MTFSARLETHLGKIIAAVNKQGFTTKEKQAQVSLIESMAFNNKELLEMHFGDPRDLSALINDLQRMKQLNNQSPLRFSARLETHLGKMIAAVNKQGLTTKEKQVQVSLIEYMALNSLITDLEPKIGQIIRASDPDDIVSGVSRIKRELQLHQIKTQKSNNYSSYRT